MNECGQGRLTLQECSDPLQFVEVPNKSELTVKARTNQRDRNWFCHVLREGRADVGEGSDMKEAGFADRGHMVLEGEPTIQGNSKSFKCICLDPSASHINRFVRVGILPAKT